jgi:hypothetical protein
MFDDDELHLDLGRQGEHGAENHDERPGVLAGRRLLLDSLQEFRGVEKSVEVLQQT